MGSTRGSEDGSLQRAAAAAAGRASGRGRSKEAHALLAIESIGPAILLMKSKAATATIAC